MNLTCPSCHEQSPDEPSYIRHRFDELAAWFTRCGEHDNAERYATKNPNDFHLVNGIIERKATQ